MDQLTDEWRCYFEELNPQERLNMLRLLENPGDELWEFCRTLYQQRYSDAKSPNRKVDAWLWKLVYLPGLYKRSKFLRKAMHKELEGTLRELYLDTPGAWDGAKKTALYLEFRNTARRYLSTCKGVNYASKLMGMKKATDAEKLDKACEDIWMASRGLAYAAGLEESLALWCDALHDELITWNPICQRYYAQLEQNIRK